LFLNECSDVFRILGLTYKVFDETRLPAGTRCP
jgi:hypothetical protein